MPTYGYRCGTCGHEFEIVQNISAEPLTRCPKCQGKLSKMLYPAGIIFKGSGYYTTDYKASSDSHAGNGSASGSGEKTDVKTETKSETRAESKAETKSDGKSATKSEGKFESKSDTKSDSKSDSKTEKAS